jgi:hypothetical protein
MGKFIPQAIPLFIYAIRYANLLAMALESFIAKKKSKNLRISKEVKSAVQGWLQRS